jgi:hypothetical protein
MNTTPFAVNTSRSTIRYAASVSVGGIADAVELQYWLKLELNK